MISRTLNKLEKRSESVRKLSWTHTNCVLVCMCVCVGGWNFYIFPLYSRA